MASEEIGLVQSQRLGNNGLNPQLVFHDGFNCGASRSRVGDPGPKTRELSGFIDDQFFQAQGGEFRRSIYGGDGSEGDEDEEDDDDVDDDENDEVNKNSNNSNNNSGHSSADHIGSGKDKHISCFAGGSSNEVMMKNCNMVQSGNNNNSRASPGDNQQGRVSQYHGGVTVADPDGDLYYSHYVQGQDGSVSGQKDMAGENGCGFSERKDGTYSSESGECLKTILSDPLTGALMDDAMILPCGHSFGAGGIQHIIRMKACYTCAQAVSEDSVSPNLSLRAAVQAFRREEEQVYRASKRRRERFERDKGSHGDTMLVDHPRGRGVQFPFVVTDRVIIKGNKRTPQRFVGREAVVTTQCLNGWYVVKTLDNAESVKLQYRSLAKVSDNPSIKPMPSKTPPNWL